MLIANSRFVVPVYRKRNLNAQLNGDVTGISLGHLSRFSGIDVTTLIICHRIIEFALQIDNSGRQALCRVCFINKIIINLFLRPYGLAVLPAYIFIVQLVI